MRRFLPAFAFALLVLPGVSAGGGGAVGGGPAKLQGALSATFSNELRAALPVSGRVTSIRWTARHGRSLTTALPQPLALDELTAIRCPEGEWAGLTLIFEDGLTWTSGSPRVFEVTELDLVLVTPLEGGSTVDLRLDPALDGVTAPGSAGALRSMLEDGVLVEAARSGASQ